MKQLFIIEIIGMLCFCLGLYLSHEPILLIGGFIVSICVVAIISINEIKKEINK